MALQQTTRQAPHQEWLCLQTTTYMNTRTLDQARAVDHTSGDAKPVPLFQTLISNDDLFCLITSPRSVQPKNRGSIPSKFNGVFCHSNDPERILDPHILVYDQQYWGISIRRISAKAPVPGPRGLRLMSTAARLLRLWDRIPPGTWMSVSVVPCQVEVFATH